MFLFFVSKTFSYDTKCLQYPESHFEAFKCWAKGLKPLQENVKSNFMLCFLEAAKKANPEKEVVECLSTSCSSDDCKYCIENCSNIKEALHQTECFNGCYRHKRINPYVDFPELGMKDCEDFFVFYKDYYEETTKKDVASMREAIEKTCASNIKALPVCYAISKVTWAKTLDLLQKQDATAESFCVNMGFAQQTEI